jgi:hypothetical protein
MLNEKRCQICDRVGASDKGYCHYHDLAYKSLFYNFIKWKKAYGNIEWNNYLEKVLKLRGTGDWVKDVIEKEKSK